MNINLIQRRLDAKQIDFNIIDFMILHKFDIPIRLWQSPEPKYLLKDYIGKYGYDCIPDKIISEIVNFDRSRIWFPKLNEGDRKDLSRKFITYFNSSMTIKEILTDCERSFSIRKTIEVFSKIKKDIIYGLDSLIYRLSEKQRLKHLSLRQKCYDGLTDEGIERAKELQRKLFEEGNRGIGFSLIDPPISYKENPIIEIKTKPVTSDKSTGFQPHAVSIEIKPKNPEE